MSDRPTQIDERVLAEFESAWIAGRPIPVAESLAAVADDKALPTLIELVLIDIEFGWKNWDSLNPKPRLMESYVEEFPQLLAPELLQELLAEEYQVRNQYGDQAKFEEFEQRFPGVIDSLEFTQADATENDLVAQPTKIDIGTVIDKFTIKETIGEGGMGSVFVAEQAVPVKRQVALKVIKKGLNSKEVIARFEAERQTLALMEHPNIARILDGGATSDGQPYFVMELVRGVPITEFCDSMKLGLKDRLKLFVEVCGAIQHAHQKGIIHRDLKPSNILIAEYDGQPIPKVIDFGLAKALDRQDIFTKKSLATQFGQVVGTFKYMSPEQAAANLDIDTRTDVYALGVILYELLTGSTPIDQKTLQDQAILKLLEIIRDHDPPRPSTKLSSLNDTASTVTERRQTDPARLSQILKGDLDWVVMKALEKERDRRYETPISFAEDVQRFLSDDPVLARPPSTTYKMRKFVRKNRGLVASFATIATLLIAAIVVTSWFAYKANLSAKSELAQRTIAEDKTEQAIIQKQFADQARQQADVSAKRSNEVLKIVSESFKSTNPNEGAKADMPAKDVLFNAQKTMESSELDALGKAELLKTLNAAFFGLGEYQPAADAAEREAELRTKIQGEDHEDTIATLKRLATSIWSLGDRDNAVKAYQDLLPKLKNKLGEEHPETLYVMHNLAAVLAAQGQFAESFELFESTLKLKIKTLGADHADTVFSRLGLAEAYVQHDRYEDALPIFEEVAIAMTAAKGEDHPDTLRAMHGVASVYGKIGETEKAVTIMEQVFQRRKAKLGEGHPDTLNTMNALALKYQEAGQVDKSLPLLELSWRSLKERLGEDHPKTLGSMNNLAATYWKQKELDKSVPLFRRAVELYARKMGRSNPSTQMTVANLAVNLKDAGKLDEAIPLFHEVVESSIKYPHLKWVRVQLLDVYLAKGNSDGIDELLQLEIKDARQQHQAGSPGLSSILVGVGFDYLRSGDFDAAEDLIREGFEFQTKIAADKWNTFNTESCLGEALAGQGKNREAKLHLENGYRGLAENELDIPKDRRMALMVNAIERLLRLSKKIDDKEALNHWQAELDKKKTTGSRND